MDMYETRNGEVVFTGTKEVMDAANIWALTVFQSILGTEEGEEAYRGLPALPVLMAYRAVLSNPLYH